jgi:SAM-dependent methyltransferase
VGLQGPTPDQYATIDKVCRLQPDILHRLVKCKPHFLEDSRSIMGHILHKPFGYAGDFKIIDRIYQQEAHAAFDRWDKYALQTSAAQAVRNRKAYFIAILDQLQQEGRPIHILNVASGPARDVYEFLQKHPDTQLRFTCIDMDQQAIEYATALNRKHLDKVTFVKANVLRYTTDEHYDLVWSAGLFDYFTDQVFTKLISRMTTWVRPGGQLVVGNFNVDCNPSRAFMEIIGHWYLEHRSIDQLKQLAINAGCSRKSIKVGQEPEGVNLFLHVSGRR